jgi:hypothetical protein
MNTNNGGPAFPACNEANMNDTMGMTLRDWLAGQALAGLQSHGEYRAEPELVAQVAYEQADAMLAAREKALRGEGE